MKPTIIFINNDIMDASKAWEFFKKSFKIKESKLRDLRKKYIRPAQKGNLTKTQLASKLSKDLRVSSKDFMKILLKGGKMIKVNKKLLNTAMSLKKQGHRVVIFGNTTALFVSFPGVEKNTYQKFSKAFLSYKMKLFKQDPRFHKKMIKSLKLSPDKLIMYKNNTQLKRELEKLK